jgi:hypothetical protein
MPHLEFVLLSSKDAFKVMQILFQYRNSVEALQTGKRVKTSRPLDKEGRKYAYIILMEKSLTKQPLEWQKMTHKYTSI